MKSSFLLSIFLFIGITVYSQNKLDSLWTVWNQTNLSDTARLKAIDAITEGTVRNKPDSGYILAQRMLDLANTSGNKKYQAAAHFLQGRAYSYMPNYKKSFISYQKSISLYTEIGDLQGKAKTMAYMSGLHYYEREYDKAIDIAIQVLAIADRIGDIERSAGVSKVLGHSYLKIGAYERAIDVYQNGLRDAEKVNDKISMAFFLIAIGDLYVEQREGNKAISYLTKALQVSQEINDKQSITSVYEVRGKNELYKANYFEALEYFNIALSLGEEIDSKSKTGTSLYNIGRVHKEKQNFDLALDYFSRAKRIAEETSYQEYYEDLMINIGNIKLAQGKPSEAIRICNETYKISQSRKMIKEEQDACECLFKAHKLLNNTKDALLYHEKMTSLMRKIALQGTAKNLQNFEYFRTKLRDSIAKVEQKRTEEIRLAKIKVETERRHGLQFSGITVFVLFLFVLVFMSGRFTLNKAIAKGLVFFAFLMLFEFMSVLISPLIDSVSKGEPAYILLFNAILAVIIIPIHAIFLKMVKKQMNKMAIERPEE